MDALLEATSLTKLYGIVIGVNDVSVTLPPGVHGLLGPNGAGKSTLLKLMTGQLSPTEGEIRVYGQEPWNNIDLLRRIGFCPEQDSFYSFLTGLEFVTVLAKVSGLPNPESGHHALKAMERVGGTDFMNRKISTYSKGMRQRTKLAQALVHDPDFLILDEPLSGLDPIGRRDIMDLVIRLGKEGKSILIAGHVLHEVQSMTEEFLLIYGGRVLASGNVHEIRGLMNEVPHRITIKCGKSRELAHRLMRDLPIQGVDIDESGTSMTVRTHDPKQFYAALPDLVTELDAKVHEMVSQDDNMDAVFDYLIAGD